LGNVPGIEERLGFFDKYIGKIKSAVSADFFREL
jgi:hypothetical protein